jgi:ubiquitin-like 1-activating enzyme E1 B
MPQRWFSRRLVPALSFIIRLTVPQVFNADIKNLLIMSDMWRSRSPPVPLDYDGIMDGTFVLRSDVPESSNNGSIASGSGSNSTPVESKVNGHVDGLPNGIVGVEAANGLKDQRALTLRDNLSLFVARCVSSVMFLDSGL